MRSTFLFVSGLFRSSSHFIALRPHPYRRSQQGAIGTQKEISWCQLNMTAANA
ncbi:hypothetical protein [Microcoleus sp. Pol10D4]|uniref:hypothetical protein n=1 Tax=Microcoleus sp. Pol10D4 TaxID=3055387 RepID=UPI002FD434C4